MRKKDTLALGILEGHFRNESQARLYCEQHNLKVEFKSTSSKGAFLMKLSHKEGWITPDSWVQNHVSELRRQFSELSDRLRNLGEPTSGPTSDQETSMEGIILFVPPKDSLESVTFKDIAKGVVAGVQQSQPHVPIVINGRTSGPICFDSIESPDVTQALAKAMASLSK